MTGEIQQTLSDDLRREIFASLINAYDLQSSPHQSRVEVALDYGLSYSQVGAIEMEGIEKEWDPL